MAFSTVTNRFHFSEHLRKYLGINYRKRTVFLFKIKGILYVSTDTVPIDLTELKILKARIGRQEMFIDIPAEILDYTPNAYKVLHANGKIVKFEK